MNISLCMITKNEEEFLPRCLDSVKDVVDELIIVDTGSTDQTIPIAKSYGAEVYHFPWQNNFSEARNFGLEKAKGNWIFYIDADEVLEQGINLRRLIEEDESDIEGYLFRILNHSGKNREHVERNAALRLFRNKPKFRFSGAIHEQLPIKENYVAMTDLQIHHYGYQPSIIEAKKKSQRNLEILNEEVNKSQDDPFVYYNLGCEYARSHDYDQAISWFQKSLEHMKEEPTGYESRLYKLMGICYLQVNKAKDLLPYMDKAIEKYPDYPDLYYIRAHIHEYLKHEHKALVDFLTCLLKNNEQVNYNLYVIEDGVTSYKALSALGRVFIKTNKTQEALTAFGRALKHYPYYQGAFLKIKEIFGEDKKGFIQYLDEKVFLEYSPQKSNYLKGINFYHLKEFEQAVFYFSQFKKGGECYYEATPYFISSLWIIGKIDKAKRILSTTDNPSQCIRQVASMFLRYGEEKLEEGLRKYPANEELKKEALRFQKVKANGNFQTAP